MTASALVVQPAGVRLLDRSACAPDCGVALETAAEAELPDAVALAHGTKVLYLGQDVPAKASCLASTTCND